MNTSEVLDQAADIIENRGLWKGTRTGSGTGYGTCASNAITEVTEMDRDSSVAAHVALLSYIGADLTNRRGVWNWNDAPERTQAEVVEALRACADLEASRERETATV